MDTLTSTGSITPNNVHAVGKQRSQPMQTMIFPQRKAAAQDTLLNVAPLTLLETQDNTFKVNNSILGHVAQDRSFAGIGLTQTEEDLNPVRRRVGLTNARFQELDPVISMRATNPAPT